MKITHPSEKNYEIWAIHSNRIVQDYTPQRISINVNSGKVENISYEELDYYLTGDDDVFGNPTPKDTSIIEPEFNGGIDKINEIINKQIIFENDTFLIEKVYVQIDVNKEGIVENPKILKSNLTEIDNKKIIKIIKKLPRFKPATSHNKKINIKIVLPITIKK